MSPDPRSLPLRGHPRTRPLLWLGLAFGLAVLVVLRPWSGSATQVSSVPTAVRSAALPAHPSSTGAMQSDLLPTGRGGNGGSGTAALGFADGVLPGPVDVFADYPALTHLDPEFVQSLRSAASEARTAGVFVVVDSGWRSKAYQQQLFDRAVTDYGSAGAAARWVARPGASVHEAGHAVDVASSAASAWLASHGAAYGLCRMYANESWHFEWRPDARTEGCPAMYADPTQDPRLQS